MPKYLKVLIIELTTFQSNYQYEYKYSNSVRITIYFSIVNDKYLMIRLKSNTHLSTSGLSCCARNKIRVNYSVRLDSFCSFKIIQMYATMIVHFK